MTRVRVATATATMHSLLVVVVQLYSCRVYTYSYSTVVVDLLVLVDGSVRCTLHSVWTYVRTPVVQAAASEYFLYLVLRYFY